MPLSGDAFLTGTIPIANNPLDRINYSPFKSVLDVQAFIAMWTQFVEQYLIPIIKDLTGIDLSFLAQIFDGIDLTSPGAIVQVIEKLIMEFVARILAPFGGGTEVFTSLTDAFNELVGTLTLPFQAIEALQGLIEDLFAQHDSQIASLKSQISALHQSKQTISTPDAGWDPCVDASGFDTPLVGSFTPTGYGTLTSASTVFGHYGTSPGLERNRVGAYFKTKRVGYTLLYFCSDNPASNWCGLLLNIVGNGHDLLSVVTGSGPVTGPAALDDLVTRGVPYELRLPSSGFFECAYEPFSDTSPTSNMFHFFLGGQEIVPLRWNDAGNATLHTTGSLRWGIGLNLGNDAHKRGYDVTDVSYGNWETGAPQ